jgi:hypothetical protein
VPSRQDAFLSSRQKRPSRKMGLAELGKKTCEVYASEINRQEWERHLSKFYRSRHLSNRMSLIAKRKEFPKPRMSKIDHTEARRRGYGQGNIHQFWSSPVSKVQKAIVEPQPQKCSVCGAVVKYRDSVFFYKEKKWKVRLSACPVCNPDPSSDG